ncbi:MAG: lipid carrier--UDP-N-acetylgalactosaminyltransferase [Clostridia bacterium]|nr:lipid carrier--UDP-N-acetylgalactosaminyltransferase [Clostridia bacterium]
MPEKKLLLVGAGSFGCMAAELAIRRYDCAFVDDGHAAGETVCGVPVVGCAADLSRLRGTYGQLVVCVGNHAFRKRVYEIARVLGYEFPNIVAPSAYVSPFAKMGNGCVLMQNVCVQNGAVVGDGVLLNAGVEIHGGGAVDDYALIYTNSVVRTGARVGKLARIGSNSTIGKNAIVPDGAEIPDCTAVR